MTLYYAVIWLKSDTSGEAGFAVITGVLIPVVFFLKQKVIVLSTQIKDESLKVNIVRKNIRCYHQDIDYGIQLDLEIYAQKNVSIKNIQLTCIEPIDYGKKIRELEKLFKMPKIDTDLLADDFEVFLQKLEDIKKIYNFPIIINESEHLMLTIVDYVQGQRLSDGFEGLKLDGWKLIIEYNDNKKYCEEFRLNTHPKTLKIPTEYRDVGFA